jgi:hypothetical protein
MTDAQILADKVECELIYGTHPSLIVALVSDSPCLRVQDIVSVLSRCGFNATATRLYEANEARKEPTQ